ncbi:MAG: deoxyribodipyrimidine photo-lyase [Roseitalea porphyridii]|uniref:cryptochrome/photolyase family protein n=1 Tax=Roseitalea porphyridii TaxID=1852022 RepID=UPI0032D905E4
MPDQDRTRPTDLPDAPVIVWFRADLRLRDNGALSAAAASGRPVIALFVLDETGATGRPPGGAQRWWLHHSLTALGSALGDIGVTLILRRGDPRAVLDEIIDRTGAQSVLWNRRYGPEAIALDSEIKASLADRGLTVKSFAGALMHEPTKLKTGSGGYYKVYSPFWRAFIGEGEPRRPDPAPETATAYDGTIESDDLADWYLLPTSPDWSGGIAATWTPGEKGAHERLKAFCADAMADYGRKRDLPGVDGTSRLSPHLAFGEITPSDIWYAAAAAEGVPKKQLEKFHKELAWREFSYHLLVNFPDLRTANFNDTFDAFPWEGSADALEAWQKGRTGYPIVDAGMRQLWRTGWMHNRVRMITASFLIKHLMIDWRRGEDWFWDTLVDGDPASNAASWQWVAGSGADAAPYFRIFNPILQGEKFDPDGAYVRRFVPELADLPDRYIHKPWEAPRKVLEKAKVSLGSTYPEPMVEHKRARERALDAYNEMRGQAA